MRHEARVPRSVLEDIAARAGTPAYVYDGRALEAGVARWTRRARPGELWYSVKANSNRTLLRRLAQQGIGFEVATPGEYARARVAGIPADRILFGGVPKRDEEVAFALGRAPAGVVLQSAEEVQAAAGHADPEAPVDVGLRVRPGIRAGSHPALETGAPEAKFGLAPGAVPAAWSRLAARPGLRPRLLAVHLGSGVSGVAPYLAAVDVLLKLADRLAGSGSPVRDLDLGGGLAVDYAGGRDPDPAELVAAVWARVGRRELGIRYEPGRSVVARAGLLLTRVLYRRERNGRPALVCDAAFSDFARYVLYRAFHRIEPLGTGEGGEPSVDVLGATCESGDVLGTRRALHGVRRGDLLVVRDVGAYGFTMASNYNGRPRPAEILVEDGSWQVIRRRERLRDLWRGEEPWELPEPPSPEAASTERG